MSLEKGQKIGRQYLNFIAVITDGAYCTRFFEELQPFVAVTKAAFDLQYTSRKGLPDRHRLIDAFRSKQL